MPQPPMGPPEMGQPPMGPPPMGGPQQGPSPEELAQFLLMMQGQQGGGTGGPNPLAMPMLPQQGATMPQLGMAPGAMSSQAMPSQEGMSAQDMIPDIPQELILDQMRRAQRPPTPRGM